MSTASDPFLHANFRFRQIDHLRWQRSQSKRHILRSQLGFRDTPPSTPVICRGCRHYHGIAYGYARDSRTALVCAMHPFGWQGGDQCPDWEESVPGVMER